MALKLTDNAPLREPAERWTTADAAELYDVAAWGKGYFSVGHNGHVWVHPTKDPARYIDLKELIDKWTGVASAQVAELYALRGDVDEAFAWIDRAIADHDGGIMEGGGLPQFAVLHSDPRWAVFRKRMNYDD